MVMWCCRDAAGASSDHVATALRIGGEVVAEQCGAGARLSGSAPTDSAGIGEPVLPYRNGGENAWSEYAIPVRQARPV